MKYTSLFIFFLVIFLTTILSCQLLNKSAPSNSFFTGTIEYDVEVIPLDQVTDEVKTKRNLVGTKMALTVFENGDIQRIYTGSNAFGYDAAYVNVNENLVFQKYKANDSIYLHDASTENMIKISNVRVAQNTVETVANIKCETMAIGVQEINPIDKKRSYLTLYYSYNESIRLDKSKYAKINTDLWSYFMSENNGAIFLKFEQDYATHKIVYTATSINKGVFPELSEQSTNFMLLK